MNVAALPDLDDHVIEQHRVSRGWQTVVWNDPVNLMSYVVHVFRVYFGYPRERAEHLMLAVHHDGHAVVAEGAREQMELHAQAMHDFGLWATVREVPE
ncbi:ATP-dependent Clp protease adapter ClpS [Microbacterium xanthum]|uniref:ATP-dependent Clp protease adapter ClpS n=1 Tax=Microbacterium xanthum TaxID=3079794 RepID=UPI002AD410B7|nr:ATP-dependent Clp protease adapter ClpS [Microbacterium sp. KSW-48]MDZ8172367.1 ATP-dependent Clp protease adapter ClpS [Microbacterium sp. KSW-48]